MSDNTPEEVLRLIIANVRTYVGRYTIPISPLTIVTGENSAGKTTLLGALATVSDSGRFPGYPPFRRPPYQFGGFRSVASHPTPRAAKLENFTLGFTYKGDSLDSTIISAEAMYSGNRNDNVELSSLLIKSGDKRLHVKVDKTSVRGYEGNVSLTTPAFKESTRFNLNRRIPETAGLSIIDILVSSLFNKSPKDPKLRNEFLHLLMGLTDVRAPLIASSIAPIRTRPERVYGSAEDITGPDGAHIPFVLNRLFTEAESATDRELVEQAVQRFGTNSGLFDGVTIRRLGQEAGDPFQIMVRMSKRWVNLVDVGYGVSQVLPVIVESILTAPNSAVLLQQPEVHLHPRAQAALGTFFAELAAGGTRTIVIETHSDYIIDRIRQEVAKGTIRSSRASILYLTAKLQKTTVHQLSIDEMGNIIGAPKGYRDFFMREEIKLITRGERRDVRDN